MEIHKLGAVWVAWSVFGGRPLYCVAGSWTRARGGVNKQIVGVA
jgi:hypothetical protein